MWGSGGGLLLHQRHHGAEDPLRRVGDAQLRHGAGHGRTLFRIVENAARGVIERVARSVLLEQERRAAVLLEDAGVLLLMVIRDIGRGTMTAGTPRAVISLTVEAPARQITRSAARITSAMLSI